MNRWAWVLAALSALLCVGAIVFAIYASRDPLLCLEWRHTVTMMPMLQASGSIRMQVYPVLECVRWGRR